MCPLVCTFQVWCSFQSLGLLPCSLFLRFDTVSDVSSTSVRLLIIFLSQSRPCFQRPFRVSTVAEHVTQTVCQINGTINVCWRSKWCSSRDACKLSVIIISLPIFISFLDRPLQTYHFRRRRLCLFIYFYWPTNSKLLLLPKVGPYSIRIEIVCPFSILRVRASEGKAY